MDRTDQQDRRYSILKEYSSFASGYDKRWSYYVNATANATIARLSLPPNGGRILDVGCGTGVLLQKLAHKFSQLTLVGLDPVPEMLTIARERVPYYTELCTGWAEELPFPDNDFDVVVSCSVFHYLQNPVSALMEMNRVIRPRGELLITDWCNDYLTCRVCDWWLRLFNPAHMKAYRSKECFRLLRETGYLRTYIERYKINWFWGMMTAKASTGSNVCR